MAPDARFVDVTYRGLRVATRARLTESAPGTGFVEVEAPLPVGTSIKLGGDTAGDARVTGVVEQEAGAKSPPGMRIVWGEALAPKPVPVPPPMPAESASPSESESVSAPDSDSESDSAAESVTPSSTDSTPPGEPGRGRRRRKKPGRSS